MKELTNNEVFRFLELQDHKSSLRTSNKRLYELEQRTTNSSVHTDYSDSHWNDEKYYGVKIELE
ncbi:hypothetical protein BCT39_08970 [Vibrio lentus]|uniref:hypothetical protein n=1 Tax=Vibrio lentus TaxID=136468 RepID=UPI000C84EFAE|nr:hypothetical protein [Vibrio lentus]PMN12907.1 hypothetical protein BCT39_08970 [Vibrio lentus]